MRHQKLQATVFGLRPTWQRKQVEKIWDSLGQQGPLAPGGIGLFLVSEQLLERLLYIEPLRRRMRVRFGGAWIADS